MKKIEVVGSNSGGRRMSAEGYVLSALASGKMDEIRVFDLSIRTFAPDRTAYNALGEKVPLCFIRGARCSNSHFVAELNNGLFVVISIECGKVISGLLTGRLTEADLEASEAQRKQA